MLTDENNKIDWHWQGRGLEGALVAGNPLAGTPACMQTFAETFLNMSLSDHRDEVTNRLLDALKWFGDASFEESGGVQIVKWIAGLERLVATDRIDTGITHRFCSRVAILAGGLGIGLIEKAYRDARKAYELRSDVMHGSRSQDDDLLVSSAGLVHDLAREALLGALAVHHLVGTATRATQRANISKFYEQAALRHEALFERLKKEYGQRARSKNVSP